MASLTYELTLAGLSVGAAAALTGVGLVVTYRATGVLNFAHGAIAVFCAYLLRQFVVVWDWPLWAGAALVLLGVAPALGLALERGVFRPLAVSGNDPARTLVASIGVFVLLVGAAALLWGTGAQEDAPVLISADPWGQLAVVCAVAVAVWAVTRLTRFGGELRAVVDDRRLAVLGGVDADRVAAVGWAFGACTAGLTGVLLAPYVRLDPYGLPLLVMEVVAVAVAARMRYLSVAVGVALAVGVAQSQLTRLHPGGWAQPLLQAVGANLFVVALLVAALVLPAVGGAGALSQAATRRVVPAPPGAWPVAGVLFLLPLGFAGSDLHTAVQVPALALILLSLVVVTGRAGQLALGQGAFAGLGALFAVLLSLGRFPGLPQLPGPAALVLAVLLVAPLGLLTALPAIRRHGLALALATFAVGVGVSRFVLAQPYAAGLAPPRPAGLADDRAFYALELVLLCGALLVVRQVRQGRSGRALAALRDDEAGAAAAGVPVAALKVAAFVLAAALAALGGALLSFGLRSFDPASFDPVRGLLWFAAIVVLGADGPLSALLGAALLVGLDAGARGGVAAATVGLLAVLVGRFPEGPYEAVRSLSVRARGRGRLTERGDAVRVRLGRVGTGADGESAARDLRDGGPAGPAPRTGRPHGRTASGPDLAPSRSAGRKASPAPEGRPSGSAGPHTPATLTPRAALHAPAGPEADAGRPAEPSAHVPGAGSGPGGAPPSPPPAPRAAAGPPGRAPVLACSGIVVRFGGRVVLDGVGVRVEAGRVTAVVGDNGAGKSTLFHCLAGTLRPDAGRVSFGDRDVTRTAAHARTRLGVARTFQQLVVFPSLSVGDNIRVGAEQGHVRDPGAVARLLRLLRVPDGRRTDDLSTGTLRRVELARALAGRPHVLLLDEPTAGLDDAEVAELTRLLRALAADGTALLIIEHDLELVAALAGTVHVLEGGRIVASGPPGEVLPARAGR
ncbi:ABC transporter permease subunit [Streptomyces xanthii]|uniref:ATP-binding cassette domain-containing protein n=1 Tax=Streptomyces xanthii TaxID=2768069 RepID=A0A7H1BEB8_9ACTN|nr:ATP-binding cassette domain-containing protein [Streptomyces xanthii]QNS07073.1 ATP-binding cassette domain-containing protein [Streptomyces xanthii]